MKKILFVAICIIGFCAVPVFGDEATHKTAALKLLEVTNARSMADQIIKSMEGMMEQQFQTLSADSTPEGREAMEVVRKECRAWLSENLGWDEMKGMYVDVYTQVFTESEIDELIQFYQSPLGRKVLEKMPVLLQTSAQRSQARIMKKMPEFQERLKKSLTDLEAKYKNR